MFSPPLMTFLCIFGVASPISSFIMDFPSIPDDLGGLSDFGDLGDAATATFSFDDFSLADETSAGTSSTAKVTETVGTSGGASYHPSRLSRGNPIPIVYNLETHAWITHHHLVSFICFLSCCSVFAMIALAIILYVFICSSRLALAVAFAFLILALIVRVALAV